MCFCAATGVQGGISSKLHALSLRHYQASLQQLMNPTTATITEFFSAHYLGFFSLSPRLHATTHTEVFLLKPLNIFILRFKAVTHIHLRLACHSLLAAEFSSTLSTEVWKVIRGEGFKPLITVPPFTFLILQFSTTACQN